jgi:hypothetical protein
MEISEDNINKYITYITPKNLGGIEYIRSSRLNIDFFKKRSKEVYDAIKNNESIVEIDTDVQVVDTVVHAVDYNKLVGVHGYAIDNTNKITYKIKNHIPCDDGNNLKNFIEQNKLDFHRMQFYNDRINKIFTFNEIPENYRTNALYFQFINYLFNYLFNQNGIRLTVEDIGSLQEIETQICGCGSSYIDTYLGLRYNNCQPFNIPSPPPFSNNIMNLLYKLYSITQTGVAHHTILMMTICNKIIESPDFYNLIERISTKLSTKLKKMDISVIIMSNDVDRIVYMDEETSSIIWIYDVILRLNVLDYVVNIPVFKWFVVFNDVNNNTNANSVYSYTFLYINDDLPDGYTVGKKGGMFNLTRPMDFYTFLEKRITWFLKKDEALFTPSGKYIGWDLKHYINKRSRTQKLRERKRRIKTFKISTNEYEDEDEDDEDDLGYDEPFATKIVVGGKNKYKHKSRKHKSRKYKSKRIKAKRQH